MSTSSIKPGDELMDVQATLRAELIIAGFDAEDLLLADVFEPSPQVMAALALWASVSLRMLAEMHDEDPIAVRLRIRRFVVEAVGRALAETSQSDDRKESDRGC